MYINKPRLEVYVGPSNYRVREGVELKILAFCFMFYSNQLENCYYYYYCWK